MRAEQPEDVGLASGQFDDLNRQFFTGSHAPHVFLRHRLQAAMLMGDPSEHVQTVLDEGITVGTLRSVGDMRSDVASVDERTLFVALEAIVLFHHAAETLLRLILAVENDAPCPWLEITRLRQPREYPNRVQTLRTRLRSDSMQDTLAKIFYYRRDRNTPPPDTDQDTWAAMLDGLTLLIEECCEKLTSEANLYNSAKHGLSAVPGNAGMAFGTDDDGSPLLEARGPSITLLEGVRDETAGRRKWHETTHWIPADRRLALTFLVTQQIQNLWTVARRRYVDADGDDRIIPLHRDKITEVLHPPFEDGERQYRFTVSTMKMSLLYETETPESKRRIEAAAKRNRKRK